MEEFKDPATKDKWLKEWRADISSQQLKELAIFLEGLKKGSGNLIPLGETHLENLWEAVKYFQEKNN